MEQNTSHNYSSGEIDLRDLVQTLWASKLLIVFVTLIVTCIMAAYAFLSSPIYEATARMLPPTTSGLASYNIGSQLTGLAISGITSSEVPPDGIKELTVQAAYSMFLQRLNSDAVRLEFFEKLYLPAQNGNADDEASRQRYWRHLGRQLSLTIPTKSDDTLAEVTLEGTDAKQIAEWANAYVQLAVVATQKELRENLSGEITVRNKSIHDQIGTLRNVAQITRQDRILRLQNALQIAESVGLEVPSPGTSLISIGGRNNNELDAFASGNMMYLRGSKALQAELAILKQRSSDDAYIPELPDLLKRQALLKNIDLNLEHLSVATSDHAAITPEDPIKPNKALLLILGVIVGGVLGIFIAFVRRLFK